MITITQGDDKTLTFILQNSDGTAYNLTSCYLYATVKYNESDADANAIISATLTAPSPTTGYAYWALTPSQTKSILPGQYYYDIQLITSAGKVNTLVSDKFYINPEITIRTS